jgi:putative phage-type endonuclease
MNRIEGLRKIRTELAVTSSQVVLAWRNDKPLNGYLIEKNGDGYVAKAEGLSEQTNPEPPPRNATDGEMVTAEHDLSPAHAVEDSPAHGRTTGALHDHGLLYARDVADHIEPANDIDQAIDLLEKLDGVGKKGARQVVRWVVDLLDIDLAERETVEADESEPFEMPDVSQVHEIRCPYCGDVWDAVPAGVQESGVATCEADGMPNRGDCGEAFWIEATEDGYETRDNETAADAPSAEAETSDTEDTQDASTEPTEEVATDGDTHGPVVETSHPTFDPRPLPISKRRHPMLPCAVPVGRADHDTDEWHSLRAGGVGSSDAGAILGVNPHATIVDVWKTKIGDPREARPWLDEYRDVGQWIEPYLIDYLREEFGADIIPGTELGTLASIEWEHARANLDGLDGACGALEELKSSESAWGEIPESHVAQVQHQMGVTGAQEARIRQFISPIPRKLIPSLRDSMRAILDFPFEMEADDALAAWLLEEGEVVTWIVERDQAFIDRLMAREREFWGYVQEMVQPPIPDPDGTVDLTDNGEVFAAVEEWAKAKTAAAPAKTLRKSAKKVGRKTRKIIERELALTGQSPKRLQVGNHKLTFISKATHSYWNLYEGDVDDIEI